METKNEVSSERRHAQLCRLTSPRSILTLWQATKLSAATVSAKRLRAYGAQGCKKTSAKRDVKRAFAQAPLSTSADRSPHAHHHSFC